LTWRLEVLQTWYIVHIGRCDARGKFNRFNAWLAAPAGLADADDGDERFCGSPGVFF
jgi:hypothetical protein